MRKILGGLLGAALAVTLAPIASHARSHKNTIALDSTFNGTITRNSNDRDAKQFIFYDQATGTNYFLDSNKVGRFFNNQQVKISGRIGRHETLHVDVVQPVNQVNQAG